MLEFVQGDMFESPVDILVNTVNCVGVMGAGVALAFKQRYPEMFREYKRLCEHNNIVPGKMHVWHPLGSEWVINFPTKRHWKDQSRYDDIEAGLDDLHSYLRSLGPVTVAMPALGCGHGGLDWARVSTMIRSRLQDLEARIFVFAPEDSRRAGSVKSAPPSAGEIEALKALGFTQLQVPETSEIQAPLFGKGAQVSLSDHWLALLPSKDFGERERVALQSIAVELSKQKTSVSVAFLYASKVSEEIAMIFAKQGVRTVLLAPFGLLTRKSLAKFPDIAPPNNITLLSKVTPNAKWSRALFSQTMQLLREHSASVLLSDPNPEWLISTSGKAWKHMPISFVRYEQTPEALLNELKCAGAAPIGRRSEDGMPNLEHLLAPFYPLPTASDLRDTVAHHEQRYSHTSTDATKRDISIELLNFTNDTRLKLIELLAQCSPTSLSMKITGIDSDTENKIKKLLSDKYAPNKNNISQNE